MCMYVCMYACMYVYMYARWYIHTYTHTYEPDHAIARCGFIINKWILIALHVPRKQSNISIEQSNISIEQSNISIVDIGNSITYPLLIFLWLKNTDCLKRGYVLNCITWQGYGKELYNKCYVWQMCTHGSVVRGQIVWLFCWISA